MNSLGNIFDEVCDSVKGWPCIWDCAEDWTLKKDVKNASLSEWILKRCKRMNFIFLWMVNVKHGGACPR